MSVLSKLACVQGRKDETLNQELAKELARKNDKQGVKEIVENIWNKDKKIQNDCIGVMEYLGHARSELIEDYVLDFLKLLHSTSNRLVWGGMIALSIIADRKSEEIFQHLSEIIQAMEKGSVITVDNGIKTLAAVASAREEYNVKIFPFLIDHLKKCRSKDVPQHAESIECAVNKANREEFLLVLSSREKELSSSQRARIKKVYKRLKE
ncbi:hypothetical protein ACFLVY_00665 [Chloroflexota bacterium]